MNQQNENPGSSGTNDMQDYSHLPRGLLGRRGVPVGRSARLPSIRSPRDLTLGATPKRTFAPNIPVRRERTSGVGLDKDDKGKRGGGNTRGSSRESSGRNDRGRGRGRNNREYIQTQGGVFSEMSMSATPRKASSSESYRNEAKDVISVPKYTAPSIKTENFKEEESKVLDNLHRDNFIADSDDDDMEAKYEPVVVPLSNHTTISSLLKKDIKKEAGMHKNIYLADNVMGVKTETIYVKEETEDKKDIIPKFKAVTAGQLFTEAATKETEQLLLFQFPDCITVPSQQEDDIRTFIKKEPGTEEESTSNAQQTTNSSSGSLADLSEGYIGKLQILKSGKTRLVLGSLVLDVEMGLPCSFLQDLVCVRTGHDNGDMTVLGHVPHKLICRPNIEKLLSQCS